MTPTSVRELPLVELTAFPPALVTEPAIRIVALFGQMIHLPSCARIDMSKERPPTCKNLRSSQTAEKGDLESACLGGQKSAQPRADLECGDASPLFFRGDMSPRSEARTCPRTPYDLRESPRRNSSLDQSARAERDVYGRPSPTCDLVKATSVAVREPSAFTSSRKLELVTA